VDIYTRECLAIEPEQRLKGEDVVRVLNRIKITRGVPKMVHCDNGSEFSSQAMDLWAYQHGVRMAFSRPEGDGSLSRGSFVVTSPSQIYLSTTGYNTYRKTLGTPQMLELNIFAEGPDRRVRTHHDLRALASQILSLTKLNWASTDSLCGEPITTKYAGDIAYLTAVLLRQQDNFKVHAALEQTPWFI
jgi:hypothetical protein